MSIIWKNSSLIVFRVRVCEREQLRWQQRDQNKFCNLMLSRHKLHLKPSAVNKIVYINSLIDRAQWLTPLFHQTQTIRFAILTFFVSSQTLHHLSFTTFTTQRHSSQRICLQTVRSKFQHGSSFDSFHYQSNFCPWRAHDRHTLRLGRWEV